MWTAFCDSRRGWTMSKDRFVLAPIKSPYSDNRNGEVVRIPKDEYNLLIDMKNESSMSKAQIVAKAIRFAYEHLEYGYEKEDEE